MERSPRTSLTLLAMGMFGIAACSACGAIDERPPASGRACTDIGCSDGLRVTFQPTERWPAGAYRFDLQTETGSVSCSGSLPLPPCGTPGLTCVGIPVQIGESGCALPAQAHGFADITLGSAPALLRIRISRDAQLVTEREFQPVYRRVEPNGPGCGPVCNSASEQIAVF